jgi:beta-propeller uncharacterized protein DUF5122
MAFQSTDCRPRRRLAAMLIHISLMLGCLLGILAWPVPAAAVSTAVARADAWVTNGQVRAVVQTGSTIYLGGSFTYVGPPTGSFVLLGQGSGAPNLSLPRANGTIAAVAADGTGGWYIGGTFTLVGGVTRNRLAHIHADGTLDPAWDPNASAGAPPAIVMVNTLVVSGTTVYVGGSFTSIGGQTRNSIAALDATTGQATAWNPNATGGLPPFGASVTTLAVSGTTVYAGGSFTGIGGQTRNSIAALDATVNTNNATAWDPNANGSVSTLVVSGATVYVGGSFTGIGGQTRNSIAALDATVNTNNATAWDPNANSSVNTLALSGTTVYAGGTFTSIGGQTRNAIAALDATVNTNNATAWDPNASSGAPPAIAIVNTLALSGAAIYVGGTFTSIGGQTRNNIAALDATSGQATAWNPNAGGAVRALVVSGTSVAAGGNFNSVGGQTRNNIAALDATSGQATAWNPNASGTPPFGFANVNTLALSGTTVYVGGSFSSIGGQTRNAIAALDAGTGLATGWNPNATGGAPPFGFANVNTLVVSGTTVYAGGSFTGIGGQVRNNIAALDATSGQATAWDPNATGGAPPFGSASVNTLALSGTTVYAGGGFTGIGGQTRNAIAALDATVNTNNATAWDPNASGLPPFGATVNTLVVSGTMVYAGGSFTGIGGQVRNNIAALDATVNTNNATAWNPNPVGTVSTLAVSGATVYAGGSFTSIGGQTRNAIAALDASTGAASAWDPNAGSSGGFVLVSALAVSASRIVVGGSFETIGGQVQPNIALFQDPPIASASAATNVTISSATLNGTVNAQGLSTTVQFQYTTTSGNYTSATTVAAAQSPLSGTSATAVSANVSGLTPLTTYFYRIVATSPAGSVTSAEQSFTTNAAIYLPLIRR